MDSFILSTMESGNTGLQTLELPTGEGKTFNASKSMAAYVQKPENKRKVIFLTTLTKNLPEKELFNAFGGDEKLYNRYVLRIRSNFDEVTEKLDALEVPKDLQTAAYWNLLEKVNKYNRAAAQKARDDEYLKSLHSDVDKAEREFRHEIAHRLEKAFPNKRARLHAIRFLEEWKWVGKLYPAVFTDSHQILLMSVSKFMTRNSTLIEKSYEFLSDSFLKDAIIFVDEFDATKATIQDHIIEQATQHDEEYLALFKQIYSGLNEGHFTRRLQAAYERLEKGQGDSAESSAGDSAESSAGDSAESGARNSVRDSAGDGGAGNSVGDGARNGADGVADSVAAAGGTPAPKPKEKYTFGAVCKEAERINKEFCLNLAYKTAEESIDHKKNFLLKDTVYHTVFSGDKSYIRACKNKGENRIDVFLESRKDFYKNKAANAENDIVVLRLLREINGFLGEFRVFLYNWATSYQRIVNSTRDLEDDAMIFEDAVKTITSEFRLSEGARQILMQDMRNYFGRRKKKAALVDISYYQRGLEIFELEDHDSHHEATNFGYISLADTPEKILLYMAERAQVIGISATAEVSGVVGNYNLSYLQYRLEDALKVTPAALKQTIANKMAETHQAYADGRVQVHTEVVAKAEGAFDLKAACEKIFFNQDYATACANMIGLRTGDEYYQKRYCNIAYAMRQFCIHDIYSMLYLGCALPKRGNAEMDESLLRDIFEKVLADCRGEGGGRRGASSGGEGGGRRGASSGGETGSRRGPSSGGKTGGHGDSSSKDASYIPEGMNKQDSLVVLRGANFDEEKDAVLARLAAGEKIFIMSAYQTIGAGQNLQYKIPEKLKDKVVELVPYQGDGDKRHFYKDFDALYLGEVTHLTPNTFSEKALSKIELIQMLCQIQEVKENAEMSFQDANKMIRNAFYAYTNPNFKGQNLLYKAPSVLMQATQIVMQAVGRLCRTFVKSPSIYLFIEESLLEKLSAKELGNHILPPEMQAIKALREELGATYSEDQEHVLNEAEKVASYGMWRIRQMLSRNWDESSMQLWAGLRELVLKRPTAEEQDWTDDPLIKELYITSGAPQNSYLYSQYSDFREVVLDFGMDKTAFRNSERAMRKADGEPVVYEMSEAESGLAAMLRYPGMREMFEAQGYATAFKPAPYLMSPVLFHNIYKGALGEVCGSFILRQELGIELHSIEDPAKFEFFDFELAPGVYVDFKNWKSTYLQDREAMRKEVLRKLGEIGGKRVYIINVVGEPGAYEPTEQIDGCVVEIPCLIDQEGHVVQKCLNTIRRGL